MLEYNELERIQKKLKETLTEKRYRHTLGVQYTAVSLAMRYGVDLQQAALAGLLHDCAKCLNDEKMIRQCVKNHIPISEVERKQPDLLHAKLGACLAAQKYGVADQEICQAIRYHTTGRAGMSQLEAIVFTADYMEPNRKMLENLPAIRQMAFLDLEEAVYMILRDTIAYLESGARDASREIEMHTMQAYEYYQILHCQKYTLNDENRGK